MIITILLLYYAPYVYNNLSEPRPLRLTSQDVSVQSINISWSALSLESLAGNQAQYTLSVTTDDSTETFLINEPYYIFTDHKSAPPCEVYNFSVTATYVGATYTGAGCCETSPVLSITLPSLPNISSLESSLYHSVEKHSGSTGGVVLNVFFEKVSCNNNNYYNNSVLNFLLVTSQHLSIIIIANQLLLCLSNH